MLNTGSNRLTGRAAEHCNSPPREAAEPPSLEARGCGPWGRVWVAGLAVRGSSWTRPSRGCFPTQTPAQPGVPGPSRSQGRRRPRSSRWGGGAKASSARARSAALPPTRRCHVAAALQPARGAAPLHGEPPPPPPCSPFVLPAVPAARTASCGAGLCLGASGPAAGPELLPGAARALLYGALSAAGMRRGGSESASGLHAGSAKGGRRGESVFRLAKINVKDNESVACPPQQNVRAYCACCLC